MRIRDVIADREVEIVGEGTGTDGAALIARNLQQIADHFHRNLRQRLDQILPHQGRVPRGAAGQDRHPFDGA